MLIVAFRLCLYALQSSWSVGGCWSKCPFVTPRSLILSSLWPSRTLGIRGAEYYAAIVRDWTERSAL